MVKISHIKNVLENMKQDQVVDSLNKDESFFASLGRAFDEYILENEGRSQLDLEKFTMKHIKGLQNNVTE